METVPEPGRSPVRTSGFLAVCTIALWVAPANTAPAVRVFERETVTLHVRSLTARPIDPPEEGFFRIAVDPAAGGRATLELAWPTERDRTSLELRAEELPPRPGAPHVVRLLAAAKRPGGRSFDARREIAFDESSTSLFEVARDGERALTLAVEALLEVETVVESSPGVGAPVRFQLEIQRVEGAVRVPLETNTMNTFVGDPVTYSFRLGPPGESASARVSLRPVGMVGDVLRVEAEVSGMLPEGEGLALLSRNHQWLAISGTTSVLDFETGVPPRGFRFLVTPVY